MRFMKALCLCSCIMGVIATSAVAQDPILFLAPDGAEGGGNQTVFMAPGGTLSLSAWVNDVPNVDLLNFYQVVVKCNATGGTAGGVAYVAGSLDQNQARADWVFASPPGGINPATNLEDCGPNDGFGSIGSLAALSDGVDVGSAGYLLNFDVVATGDACGTFTLAFTQPGQPPQGGTSMGDNAAGPFGPNAPGTLDLQSLTIVVGPQNDACADAEVVGNGATPFFTLCSTTDGPAHPGSACDVFGSDNVNNDVWYSYTATCTGTLNVSTCNTADFDTRVAVYNAGAGCTPTDGDLLGCNDDGTGCSGFSSDLDVSVNSGDTHLIRVGGFGPTDDGSGTLSITCTSLCDPLAAPNSASIIADCVTTPGASVDVACTDVSCDAVLGCVYTAKAASTTCDDADVCTLTDNCSGGPLDPAIGGGSCVGSNVNPCDDFKDCTADSCDQATGDAVTGCVNGDLNGAACTADAECQAGGNASATCDALVCSCVSGQNLNPENSLCLDIRGAGGVAQGTCTSEDSGCGPSPDGILQCSDDNGNPLDGGVCVDQACYGSNEIITIDIELGPTTDFACGAQLFLQWDTSSLDFKGMVLDADGEFGWSMVFLNIVNEAAGTIDLALGLPIGVACNGANGSNIGGTVARLTFNSTADCKSGGVWFRDNNPPTRVGGSKGAIDIVGCNGSATPSGTDQIQVQDDPEWICPAGSDGDSNCGSNLRQITMDPVSVSDACDEISATAQDLCTVQFFTACDSTNPNGGHLDCGNSGLCADVGTECPGLCIDDSLADGFICAGAIPCTGFCQIDTCTGGTCDTPSGLDMSALLDGGIVTLPPGRAVVHCEYTNGCGNTGTCDTAFGNTGLNRMCVDVEMSPSMVSGDPNNPISRCIDFELSVCDGGPDSGVTTVAAEVDFGAPNNIPGHGSVCFKVPPGNWTCLSAVDPKHSLVATCDVACVDNVWEAAFKGSPTTNAACHWLIQGNLDGEEHIDILDYTILAGQYLTVVGEDTLCKDPLNPPPGNNFHADLNGDGLVTLADFTFVVFNFFNVAKDPCSVICNPGAATAPKAGPRSEVSVRELVKMGLGDFVEAADVNSDGTVNLVDVAEFLEANAEGDDPLVTDLLEAVDVRRASESAGLR